MNSYLTHNNQQHLFKQLSKLQHVLPTVRGEAKSSLAFIKQSIKHSSNPIVTTSFGPQSGVLLHMITQVIPDIPVIWIDSGYNIPATYHHAEKLSNRLQLNLHVYTPNTSAGYWDANHGGIPTIGDKRHQDFTQTFKIAPFQQALGKWQPDVWFSSIRKNQSDFRANLSPVHLGPLHTIKLAPLFYWQASNLLDYLQKYKIADEVQFFDPVKAHLGRECGLHKL